MPMMMEDYEDLFTDTLNLPSPTPVPGLQERLDELRYNGACHKIAWSKMGCIAYITADNKEVRVANLQHHQSDGSWSLSLKSDCILGEHISRIFQGRELINLSWSPSGQDLLVADVHGRLSIFQVRVAINRLAACKSWPPESDNHLNALVGITWLNAKGRTVPLYRSASKTSGTGSHSEWSYEAISQEAKGPCVPWTMKLHPNPLAFIVVTRIGYVRLVYQRQDNQWQDVKYEIDDLATSDDLLTHATLCPEKGDTLLLATHTIGKQLRLYRLGIDWQHSPGKDQVMSLPRITFQHLQTIDECCPLPTQTVQHPDGYMMHYPEVQLSHLDLVPSFQDVRNKDSSFPTVLATFSYTPFLYSAADFREQSYTIMSRWELCNQKSTIHPSFSSLASKKSNSPANLKEMTVLRRMEDVRLDRVAVQVQPLNLNTILVLAYADGVVEFRDRTSLQNIPLNEGPDKVTSLFHTGFGFPDVQPCLHTAFSPNTAVKAYIGIDQEPKICHLRPPYAGLEVENSDIIEKAKAGFVLVHATGAITNNNNDDLLLMMQGMMVDSSHNHIYGSPVGWNSLVRGVMTDLYKLNKVNFDQSTDPAMDTIFRVTMMQRLLSLQAVLEDKNEKTPRSIPSKLAWTILNLRMIAISFGFSFHKNNSSESPELSKPIILQMMVALTSWSMALTDYIIDQLFELNRSIDPEKGVNLTMIREQIAATNAPGLHLLLTSRARGLLKHNCRGLRGLCPIAEQSLQPASHSQANMEIMALHSQLMEAINGAYIEPLQFERFLAEIESLVKHAYEAATPPITDQKRQEIERHMIITGVIPEVLESVVERLVGKSVDALRDGGVEEAGLYFRDFKDLGLSGEDGPRRWWGSISKDQPDNRGRVGGSSGTGDGGANTGAGGGAGNTIPPLRMRTCARCGAVMEDSLSLKDRSAWLVNLQQKCFCGGFWLV